MPAICIARTPMAAPIAADVPHLMQTARMHDGAINPLQRQRRRTLRRKAKSAERKGGNKSHFNFTVHIFPPTNSGELRKSDWHERAEHQLTIGVLSSSLDNKGVLTHMHLDDALHVSMIEMDRHDGPFMLSSKRFAKNAAYAVNQIICS